MKQNNNKISLCGRIARLLLRQNMSYAQAQFLAAAFFVLAGGKFMLEAKSQDSTGHITSVAFWVISLIWFLKAGHIEITQKEYTKNDSNQRTHSITASGGSE